MKENECATQVLDRCFRIHRVLGPGLFESIDNSALECELSQSGLRFQREVPVAATHSDRSLGVAFRADFIVEHSLIVELKSVESIIPVHRKQLHTYLKLTNIRLGLRINFNVALLKNGIIRVANGL